MRCLQGSYGRGMACPESSGSYWVNENVNKKNKKNPDPIRTLLAWDQFCLLVHNSTGCLVARIYRPPCQCGLKEWLQCSFTAIIIIKINISDSNL